ncbi:MAG TPA: CvpA family protein [Oscillospiraceae bacterium]|nr:CvpA family protein [Oscillospiraceae bacterium]HPK34633.1 CvpA family protein [Oscillospiraceae bacterium]HPR74602.1 CvpA family protein [Oscillospiraceae bacterium]
MSVVDLVIVLIVIISVIIGFKRGFVKTLVGLVSLVLAFIIAYTFAAPISEKVYDNYLEEKLSAALGFDLGTEEELETATSVEAGSETSRMLFLGGTNLFIAPRVVASSIDISKLNNIEGMISNLDPDLVASMDASEMQKLVNFLCSSVCANKTISSCVSAYNKKYGTKIDVTPILAAAGVSSSTKIPAALSMLEMKIDVKNPILNVQKKNAEAASAAAVAAKAASSKASSKSSSKSTSSSSGSKSSTSTTSKASTTSSKTSSKISSVTTTEVTSATDIITETMDGFTQDILATAKQAARKIAVKLVSCLVFVILFLLVRLILMLFAKLLSGIIDKIPVVSGINKLLGGILGIAGGLIVSAVLVVGVVSVSPLITNDNYVRAIDNSLACRTATKLIYGDGSSDDAVTVGDSGNEDDSFNEDDFDFSEEDFDFSEEDFDFSEDSLESGTLSSAG